MLEKKPLTDALSAVAKKKKIFVKNKFMLVCVHYHICNIQLQYGIIYPEAT